MDYRLFVSTFLLIFLAELGDKTQLAALTRTAAADGNKWTVFVAASAALVLSTLIAVLLGEGLSKLIPPRTIKIGAGILFIGFGLLILKGVFLPGSPRDEAARATPPLARVVLKVAAEFEDAASADYLALAQKTSDPALADLFRALAAQEQAHLEHLRQARLEHGTNPLQSTAITIRMNKDELTHDVAQTAEMELSHAIQHEEATAAFYTGLANTTPIDALKQTFFALAAEETSHVERLRHFAEQASNA